MAATLTLEARQVYPTHYSQVYLLTYILCNNILERRRNAGADSRNVKLRTETLISVARNSPLDPYPLNLVERDLVLGAVVQLGRARRFVRRDLLRVLDRLRKNFRRF